MTFSRVLDSIVACRKQHVIGATDESEFYAFLFIFRDLL